MEAGMREKIGREVVNRNILVTGATGSIGSEIVCQLIKFKPNSIRALSNDENGLFELEHKVKEQEGDNPSRYLVRYLVGDVRTKERLDVAMEDIDVVFHAAALKHVHLCESNPSEAITTNVVGTENIVKSAIDKGVDKCVMISTDKAVDPTSVMGATKLLAERVAIAADCYRKTNCKFSVVRFGNILNTRGSVISIIKRDIKGGGPVTITDPEMTRFFSPIQDAIDMVFAAMVESKGGEIFILRMPAIKIRDLVDALIELLCLKYGCEIDSIEKNIVGPKIREKQHEVLMTEHESCWAREEKGMYVIDNIESFIKDFNRNGIDWQDDLIKDENVLISSKDAKLLTIDEIKAILVKYKILED
jgi:UDP-N-acetylglucosamine 4,6-dehydratase/5-epimerase